MKNWPLLVTSLAGLGLAGCALLPHESAPPGATPLQLKLGTIPAMRSTQTIPTGGLNVEIRAYRSTGTTTFRAPGNQLGWTLGTTPIVATYSVTAGTSPTLSFPALPPGDWLLQANVYNYDETFYNVSTGARDPFFKNYLCGQGEATVSTTLGLGYALTIPVAYTIPNIANLDDRVQGAATNSFTLTALLPGSAGLRFRLANWNPYVMLATGSWDDSHHKIRIAIQRPAFWSLNMASTSNSAGYWFLGDYSAPQGMSATQSFSRADMTVSSDVWMWNGDTGRNVIYTDIDLHGTDASYYDKFTSDTAPASGALTIVLPAALAPTGYTLTMTDLASP